MRGLKPAYLCNNLTKVSIRSHPLRVRGLKLEDPLELLKFQFGSHPLRVRGLKLRRRQRKQIEGKGRTPCGCVD